jgi:hypothetical protein
VPGYRLVRELGRGGFGEVWQATGPDGVDRALKFLRLAQPLTAAETSLLGLLQDLRHPHLLAVLASWHQPGLAILALELAEGTLLDRLTEAAAQGLPGIPLEELARYVREAAEGIDHLNEPQHVGSDVAAGGEEDFGLRLGSIQHRDIKPQNLFLVGDRVKVGDFGLAKFTEHSVTQHSGAMTMAYAAPEFFQGQTSNHSDQYSLAVSYCQLRGGRLPFAGTPAQIVAGHLHQAPDLSMLPETERPAVARALAKQPAQRWPSCRAFVEALLVAPATPLPTATVACPGCGQPLAVPVTPHGQEMQCPMCQATFQMAPAQPPGPADAVAEVQLSAPTGGSRGSAARLRRCLPWVCCAALLLALLAVLFAQRAAENPGPEQAANPPTPAPVQPPADPDAEPPANNPKDPALPPAKADDGDSPKQNPSSEPKDIAPNDPPKEIAAPKAPPGAPNDPPKEIAAPKAPPGDPKGIAKNEQPQLKKDDGLRKFTVTIINASEVKHYHYWLDANNNIVRSPPGEVFEDHSAPAKMPWPPRKK